MVNLRNLAILAPIFSIQFVNAALPVSPPLTIDKLEAISNNLLSVITPLAQSINSTVDGFSFFQLLNVAETQNVLSKDIIGIINVIFDSGNQVQLASNGALSVPTTAEKVKGVVDTLTQALFLSNVAVDKITAFSAAIPVVAPFIKALDDNFKIIAATVVNSIVNSANRLGPPGTSETIQLPGTPTAVVNVRRSLQL